jgi:hypothetical protein
MRKLLDLRDDDVDDIDMLAENRVAADTIYESDAPRRLPIIAIFSRCNSYASDLLLPPESRPK